MGMCPLTGHRVVEPEDEGGKDHDSHRGISASSSDDEGSLPDIKHGASSNNKFDQHPALCKRPIPKGRRCEPVAFSGLILNNEHGNRLHHYNQALVTRGRFSERE